MKRFLRGFAIFLALIGVGIISAFAVVALLLRQEEVRVPDLTGQDIVTVIESLNQQGLQLKIDRREPSQQAPRDAVVSQNPPGGSTLKKGRQVRVIVSLGPSDLQAPKLMGEHFRRADIMIRQAGFMPGPLSRIASESVERDMVIAQDPLPGSPLDKGGKISLLISSGKRPDTLVMPKLTGKGAEEAVTSLERMGLQYRMLTRATGGQPATGRVVIQQKPGAGSPITADAVVEIVVSK